MLESDLLETLVYRYLDSIPNPRQWDLILDTWTPELELLQDSDSKFVEVFCVCSKCSGRHLMIILFTPLNCILIPPAAF